MKKNLNFEIILGTYEEFLVGYNFNSKDASLSQSFASHSHTASIKTVAQGGRYLASAGTDDRIIVYDMQVRKEHCMLTHHNSTITCIQFTAGHTHLISGSTDGVLAIVRVGNWQLEKVWEKAHNGASILDIAVHPTGKLAITLGADYCLRTWNLIKGRQAYVINLKSKCKDVKSLCSLKWAPDSVRFLLISVLHTEIWSIETGGMLVNIEHKIRVTCASWLSNEMIVVGYQDGNLATFDTNGNELQIKKAHNVRVKAIESYKNFLVTCSSDGEVKVWNEDMTELNRANTGCRHTCLCIVPHIEVKAEIDEKSESLNISTAEFEVVQSKKKRSFSQKQRLTVEIDEDQQTEDLDSKNAKSSVSKSTNELPSKKKKKQKSEDMIENLRKKKIILDIEKVSIQNEHKSTKLLPKKRKPKHRNNNQ